MLCGKKSIAQKIVYGAFERLKEKTNESDILKVFNKALDNVSNEQILTLKYLGSIPKIITYYYW